MRRKIRHTIECACGCGGALETPSKEGTDRRYINGHNKATRTHGQSGTPEHRAYKAARQRCTNPKLKCWENYGGRGIKFLFTSFEQFYAELGPRPKGKSLDRFPNNDGNYEPGNVRWATAEQQRENRRKTKQGYKRKLKTHCVRGHEFTEGSYYTYGKSRACKACLAVRGGYSWKEQETK
jgi:hypothetical protein